MSFRALSAWTSLLALVAGLSISLIAQAERTSSEDRNRDGQADVWQLFDEGGELVRVMRDRNFDGYVDTREVVSGNRVVSRQLDQNFDHRFDPSFTGCAPAQPDVTFNAVAQPFMLPRAVFIGDDPHDDSGLVTLDSSSGYRPLANPAGRAPPASL
jgi:hypothetical protein